MSTDFEIQWSKVRVSVQNYCYRALEDRDLADDVFQVVQVKVFRRFASFRGDSAFATWVMRIAKNEVINAINQTKISGVSLDNLESVASAEDPDIKAIEEDLGFDKALQAAVDSNVLAPIDATLIRLYKVEGTPWAEIEAALCVSNAATIFMRARKRFQVFLCLHFTDLLGGPEAIERAFEKAAHARVNPLTDAEQAAFKEYVLRSKVRHRTVFRIRELRSACVKVGLFLPIVGNRE